MGLPFMVVGSVVMLVGMLRPTGPNVPQSDLGIFILCLGIIQTSLGFL